MANYNGLNPTALNAAAMNGTQLQAPGALPMFMPGVDGGVSHIACLYHHQARRHYIQPDKSFLHVVHVI